MEFDFDFDDDIEVDNNKDDDIEVDNNEDEDSDEESVLSNDNAYFSNEDKVEEETDRIIPDSHRRALSASTIMCAIYCYYTTGSPTDLCVSCMIDMTNVDLGPVVYIMRRHEVDTWDGIRGCWCTNCRAALYVIFPRNMCSVCMHHNFEH
ncbi:hypothetical protein DMN91_005600 [Ooceraea biroi]|uniref:Uncharacterized protein n=1 Tax=Ooceraea biroi TaxID=2015173 RepID=A0A026WJ36_OOCBI|nr:hypothetical protein X777_03882 [Ooceraea biroi]RLU21227.1 hypothetical protein DMN91_005600 [Ooceraea biroi]